MLNETVRFRTNNEIVRSFEERNTRTRYMYERTRFVRIETGEKKKTRGIPPDLTHVCACLALQKRYFSMGTLFSLLREPREGKKEGRKDGRRKADASSALRRPYDDALRRPYGCIVCPGDVLYIGRTEFPRSQARRCARATPRGYVRRYLIKRLEMPFFPPPPSPRPAPPRPSARAAEWSRSRR